MAAENISAVPPSPAKDFGTSLCIVTGASKGFGRSLAVEIAGLLKPGSVLLLVARSADMLEEVRVAVEARGAEARCVTADLEREDGVQSVVQAAAAAAARSDVEHLLLFNNAASLGDVSRYMQGFTDMAEVNSYWSLNLSSALCLTAGILAAFPRRTTLRRCVVNVSSLCALKPFRSWVLYCSGKAARDMMFRVLAEEEPDIRVLNYAPGPLDTDMQLQARSTSADPEIKNTFSTMHSEGRLLTCEESVSKLFKVLLEDDFPSGAHLDFYDL